MFADYAPCVPYVTAEEVLLCCKAAEGAMTEDDVRLLDAIDDASLILYYLTGRQFDGTCQRTVRPCLTSGCVPCDGCEPHQIDIGLWPVTGLISVRENGVTLVGDDLTGVYHVDEYRYLVKDDGDSFPSSSSIHAITGGPHDTDNGFDRFVFEVTVEVGLPIPRLLTRAARALACELVTSCLGLPCKLPERVTSVSRSGISMDVMSATDLLRDGRTGIYEVDLAIQVFNPLKLQSPSFIWSGQRRYGRRVDTSPANLAS